MIGQVPKYTQSETEAKHGEVDGISRAAAQLKPTDGVTFLADFRFCKPTRTSPTAASLCSANAGRCSRTRSRG